MMFGKKLFDESPLEQDIVEPEVAEKVTYWILKIIIEMGGHKDFIDNDNDFQHEDMARFLGLHKYVELDFEDFDRTEPLLILKKRLAHLQKRKPFESAPLLSKNIERLATLIPMNPHEKEILEFVILLKQYDIIDNAVNLIGQNLSTSRSKKILGAVLDISLEEINEIFASPATFNQSGILQFDKENSYSFSSKLELLNYEFADNMINLDEEITEMIKHSVRPATEGTLVVEDYSYIKENLEILLPYLNSAIANQQTGVNILLYGLPGTGKTELCKTISEILGVKLYEISYADSDDDPIEGSARLRVYKTAQALLSSNQKTILMYDEAEDVFDSYDGGFFMLPKKQSDKAWINKVLESNKLPTLWITNHIESIDNAIIRRFDMSIELPIPSKSKRAEIIKKYSNNILSTHDIELLSENEDIAPAIISTAVKVTHQLTTKEKDKALLQLINNTLKAQGHAEVKKEGELALPENYNLDFIHTDTDLGDLTEGIKEHSSARLCFYGLSGTGKSAFAKYIAKILDRPFILKSGSDLMSKWVGGTERNIANAFREAREEEAVLIFDEVDGFLAERGHAKVNWERTQVNEMLVQMENFEGIFIATTNLIDHLDKASLRRFDLKLEFKALSPKQLLEIFNSHASLLKIGEADENIAKRVKLLKEATPGDFATIMRQNRFRKIKSTEDLLLRLKEEIAIKNMESSKTMGFI